MAQAPVGRMSDDETTAPAAGLPHFDVAIAAPDLSPWREGNTGIAGFSTRASAMPGPHVALIALVHGNEVAGAIVLAGLLAAGLWPVHIRAPDMRAPGFAVGCDHHAHPSPDRRSPAAGRATGPGPH